VSLISSSRLWASMALLSVITWEIVGLASWPSVSSFWSLCDIVIVSWFCLSCSAIVLRFFSFCSMDSSVSVWSSSRVFSCSFWRKFRSSRLFSICSWTFSSLLVWIVRLPCFRVWASSFGIWRSSGFECRCFTFSPIRRVCPG